MIDPIIRGTHNVFFLSGSMKIHGMCSTIHIHALAREKLDLPTRKKKWILHQFQQSTLDKRVVKVVLTTVQVKINKVTLSQLAIVFD